MEGTNMGVYNSDWLLNQIRGTANVVSKAFKFETLDIDLGQVEDEQGHTIDGNDYNLLVSVYIEYLENLPPVIREKHHFDDRKIASLREKLSEFSW